MDGWNCADVPLACRSQNLVRRAGLFFLAVACSWSILAAGGQKATTIILVRHAEKDTMRYDPPLTAVGRERAQDLARVLERASVNAIYGTQFVRTQETVQPLADKLGLKIDIVDADASDLKGHAEVLVKTILSRHAGQVILISSHSNVIPLIVQALKAGPAFEIRDSEHDYLYMITLDTSGETKLLQLRYGRPSPR